MAKTNTTKLAQHPLVDEFTQTVLVIGKTKTREILRNARHTEQHIKCETNVKNVLQQVSICTGIAVKEIVYSIKKDDKIKIARCLSVYFLREILKTKTVDISKMLNKTTQMVGKYYNIFLSCKLETPKADFDKQMAAYYYTILPLIKQP